MDGEKTALGEAQNIPEARKLREAVEADDDHSLEEVVLRMHDAGEGEQVSLRDVLDSVGQRGFGPMLLAPSLLLVSPLSAIPGTGTTGAVIMGIIAAHLVIGRKTLWLPPRMLGWCVARDKLKAATRWLVPIAKVGDKFVRARLTRLTRRPFSRIIGLIILLITVIMPPLELVPMANTTTGAAIAILALALTAHDGVLVLAGFGAVLAGFYAGVIALMASA